MTAFNALMESLIALMIAQGGQEALSHIRDSQKQLDEFGAYWDRQSLDYNPLVFEAPSPADGDMTEKE